MIQSAVEKGRRSLKRSKDELEFFERLGTHKKIAAIKTPKGLEEAIKYKDRISAVFLLMGNILTIKNYVELFQKEGLPVFVHIEKIGGLSINSEGLDFIANYIKPLGIVTTKPNVISMAKKRKLMTVQRIFMIDTEVYDYAKQMDKAEVDLIEIMPSRLPHVIQSLSREMDTPLITGGLLTEKEHAQEALACGALAVTTSSSNVWKADLT